MALRVRVLSGIDEVAQPAWDALHDDTDSPFVEWEWLAALEATGCVHHRRGWTPRHIVVERDGLLVGAAPAYIKQNSEGEFVYDWAWADLASRLGVAYYPKLVVAVPFTPATGKRILRAPGESLDEMAGAISTALTDLARKEDLSGIHVLFPHRDEAEAFVRIGWAERLGVQFHWHNDGYRRPEDFLGRFQSKRRTAIRRERSQLERDLVKVRTLRDDALTPDLVEPMYAFYLSTVDKFFYGRRYLNREFFQRVVERFRHRLEWVMAFDPEGRPIAGAFNARRGSVLYGRYWGASEERPFLHFNVCFYHSIDEAIAAGLSRFEPGAGGEHKLARGFEPAITHSVHTLANRRLDGVLRQFLARERDAVEQEVTQALAESPIRRKSPTTTGA